MSEDTTEPVALALALAEPVSLAEPVPLAEPVSLAAAELVADPVSAALVGDAGALVDAELLPLLELLHAAIEMARVAATAATTHR